MALTLLIVSTEKFSLEDIARFSPESSIMEGSPTLIHWKSLSGPPSAVQLIVKVEPLSVVCSEGASTTAEDTAQEREITHYNTIL